ncbi:uncharacterized protein LOC127838821 [Dreissena polymorpha]|uniref:uncharacterized protein LOC127838821 n=1 Tax=Dreissena polymorpha TaxID=45954 RepID=UPI002263DDB2|nr:uncharacterized protein LOC127838821 [Dreissena polymorpha]
METVDSQNNMLAEEKVRQEARQETDRLKEEKQARNGPDTTGGGVETGGGGREAEEGVSLQEAEKAGLWGGGGKSSSKSPSPLSAGPGTPQKGQEVKTGPDRVTPVGRTIWKESV